MNVLVISNGKPNTVVTAESPLWRFVSSTFDSHGKARLRLPEGKVNLEFETNKTQIVMPNENCSLAQVISGEKPLLLEEDEEYLRWLELTSRQKWNAFKANKPIAKWASVIGAN